MEYGYGNWLTVLVSIILSLFFIKAAFKPRTKTDWRTYRLFGAFIVALFTEMFGFPLTIYLLTSLFGNRLNIDLSHNSGHLLEDFLGLKSDPHFSLLHIISNLLIAGGLILIATAWNVLYKSQKENKLAITGAYHYIRHPQYAGFILIIIGFLLQWPTLITLIMAPILMWRYFRLGKEEEKAVFKRFINEYAIYKSRTPAYIPSLKMLSAVIWKKSNPTKT